MSRVPISVLIPCYNSADVIEDCLESVTWADEIFVCDSFSTDATLEICRRYTDRIVQHEYVNSATQKNWAIPQVRHEWVLIVDTDERISPALRREIEARLTIDCPYNGFRIPRLNHVFGRPIRHGGHYPDYQLRLFRRDRGRYQDRQVHAHVDLQGPCGTLSAPLLHFGQRTVEQVARTYLLRYSAWEAEQKNRDGVRFKPSSLVVRPLGAFAVRYVKQRGFLDGTAGLFMALLVSAYVFLTYARLWQMQKEGSGSPSRPFAGVHPLAPPAPSGGAWGEASPQTPAKRPWWARQSSVDRRRTAGHCREKVTRAPTLPLRGRGVRTTPLRVGFLVPHSTVGGAEMNLRTLLAALDRTRISPVVVTAGEGQLGGLLADLDVPTICVPTPHFFSTSVRLGRRFGGRTVFNPPAVLADGALLLWAALGYARALRRARARVVHTGSIFAHLLGAIVAPLAGARLVWHVQDIVSPRLGGGLVLPFFARLGARRADLVVCPSEAVASNMRAHMPGGARDRLRVIYNGVAPWSGDLAPREEVRRSLGIPDDAFMAVHIGRLVPWKGQRELLGAAHLLLRVLRAHPGARNTHDTPNMYIVIVGDTAFEGPAYRAELHAMARRLGLHDRVVFTGWRRDVPSLLAASDALVHTSILPEPFGLVIVEAMLCERPVIASQLGAPSDIVRDGQDGFLVDPRDPAALAAALRRLIEDPQLRTRMGRSGSARARALFTADRFAAEMGEAFQRVAKGTKV